MGEEENIGWNPSMPYFCFAVSFTLVSFQSLTIVALFRLAAKNAAFVLLFASCIGETVVVFHYLLFYVEVISKLNTPFNLVEYSKLITYLLRVPGTAVSLHYVAVSYNRLHAIFFPITYRKWWTVRLAIALSLIIWLLSVLIAYLGTAFDPPQFLSVHNRAALCIFPASYKGEAVLSDNSTKAEYEEGHVTNYNGIVMGYTSYVTMLSFVLIFGRYFILIVYKQWQRLVASCGNNGEDGREGGEPTSTFHILEKHDHLKLLLICFLFMCVLPGILIYVTPYASYIPPAYLGIIVDLTHQLTMGSQALFLFFLSSMVKQQLPFRKYLFLYKGWSLNRQTASRTAPHQQVGAAAGPAPIASIRPTIEN